MSSLVIRADASVAIGTGHVMRCLALAQAWQDTGGQAVFAAFDLPLALRTRLEAECLKLETIASPPGTLDDARETGALARELGAEWVVVDGYQFDANYQSAIKSEGLRLLFVDDYGHATHYSADLILNQNPGDNAALYRDCEPSARLLLGPRYSLLRREFVVWRDWKREIPAVARHVLITMGGSDPENVTARVVEAMQSIDLDLETTVVAGGSNPHLTSLQDAVKAPVKIELRTDISNMPELMAAADVAISAAGSTCWELCQLGLPSLLIDVAANQSAVARELDRIGCGVYVGDRTVSAPSIAAKVKELCESVSLRQTVSDRSRRLVDGRGAERVLSAMRGLERIRLRRATLEDCRMFWEWANDPEVRAASFSQQPIPWETHLSWFDKRIANDTTRMWVAETLDSTSIGQIRFDARPDGDWEVHVSIAKVMRGRGFGPAIIRLGLSALREESDKKTVHAFVKPTNSSSLAAFEQCGFKPLGKEIVRDSVAVHFVIEPAAEAFELVRSIRPQVD